MLELRVVTDGKSFRPEIREQHPSGLTWSNMPPDYATAEEARAAGADMIKRLEYEQQRVWEVAVE